MLGNLFFVLILGCASRWVSEQNTTGPKIQNVRKEEVQNDWYHYLISKGVHRSLCVQGLLERLEDWDCDRIEAKKYDAMDMGTRYWIDERVEISCLIRKGDDRTTYWERNRFIIRSPVLTKTALEKINIGRHPAICIDTIHKVESVTFEDPGTQRIKLK